MQPPTSDGALRPRLASTARASKGAQAVRAEDPDKLLLKTNVNGILDVPRDGNGKAIIGDKRNDENLIIVQFHKAVIQFHNKIVEYARAQGMRKEWVFETARGSPGGTTSGP